MKQLSVLTLLIWLCCGCTSEYDDNSSPEKSTFSVADAQKLFESSNTQVADLTFTTTRTNRSTLTPDWEGAKITGTGDITTVETPLSDGELQEVTIRRITQPGMTPMRLATFKRLISQRNKYGNVRQFVVTMTSAGKTRSAQQDYCYGKSDYSGFILVSSVDGEYQDAFESEGGVWTRQRVATQKQEEGTLNVSPYSGWDNELPPAPPGYIYCRSCKNLVIFEVDFCSCGAQINAIDIDDVDIIGKRTCPGCSQNPCQCGSWSCRDCGSRYCAGGCRSGGGSDGGGGGGTPPTPAPDPVCEDQKCPSCGKCINPKDPSCQKCTCVCDHVICGGCHKPIQYPIRTRAAGDNCNAEHVYCECDWWPKDHDVITRFALENDLTPDQLAQMQEGQKQVDGDQSIKGAYKHAMRAPYQTREVAINNMRNHFIDEIKTFVKDGDFAALGRAIHPIQDAYSPPHSLKEWGGGLDFLPHMFEARQLHPTAIDAAVEATGWVYMQIKLSETLDEARAGQIFDNWMSDYETYQN